jgi:hypothetical protein
LIDGLDEDDPSEDGAILFQAFRFQDFFGPSGCQRSACP